jgi:hypothetical protein
VVLELLAEELTSVSEMQVFHRGACHRVIHCRVLTSSDFLKKTTRDETKKDPLQRTKRVGYFTSHQEEVHEFNEIIERSSLV